MRGKEKSPKETIKKAQEIIRRLGLHETIMDLEQDVEGCYSCRLTINSPIGDMIGTNGKGMTIELSHASAYGEMMERLSNRMFSAMPRFDDPRLSEFVDKRFPLYSVWSDNQPYAVRYLKERIANTIQTESPLFSKEYQLNCAIEKLAPETLNGKFMTLPFYSITDDTIEYLPSWTVIFTGSNGMAAGNTLEEAIVEALSELLERYSQSLIFDGKIIPPQIPRSFIAQFPHILQIIENIENRGKYKVRVLDCSLGKNLPVVCGLIIDLETGRFGVKFGAQPNIAVALERVFTESMQGSKLEQFANNTKPNFADFSPNRRLDKWNSIKVSSAAMPAQLLMNDATYPFIPWGEKQGRSNNEMMWSMLHLMENLGSHVFIRDASYLGFPAVNIYATGISEVRPVDFLEIKHNILWYDVQKLLTHLHDITNDDVKKIALLAVSRRGSVIENSYNSMSQLFFNKQFIFAPFDADLLYAACLYRLGQLEQAVNVFLYLESVADYMSNPEDKLFIKAVHTWMKGIAGKKPRERVLEVVQNLYPSYAEKVKDLFWVPELVLEKLYPDCKGKFCTEITEYGCQYNAIFDFYKLLFDAEKSHPTNPEELRSILKRDK